MSAAERAAWFLGGALAAPVGFLGYLLALDALAVGGWKNTCPCGFDTGEFATTRRAVARARWVRHRAGHPRWRQHTAAGRGAS